MYLRYLKIFCKVTEQSSEGFRWTFLKYIFMFATSLIINIIVYLVMIFAVLRFTSDNVDNAGANY